MLYVCVCVCVCQGITFADFKEFCQFLNNLDDFALVMRIYTYANQPISEGNTCYCSSNVSTCSRSRRIVVVVVVVVVMYF